MSHSKNGGFNQQPVNVSGAWGEKLFLHACAHVQSRLQDMIITTLFPVMIDSQDPFAVALVLQNL